MTKICSRLSIKEIEGEYYAADTIKTTITNFLKNGKISLIEEYNENNQLVEHEKYDWKTDSLCIVTDQLFYYDDNPYSDDIKSSSTITRRIVYDKKGNEVKYSSRGRVSFDRITDYDSHGNVATETIININRYGGEADSESITEYNNEYDEQGRLIESISSSGWQIKYKKKFSYEPDGTYTTETLYYLAGSTEKWMESFDAKGLPTHARFETSSFCYSLDYSYDENNRISNILYKDIWQKPIAIEKYSYTYF